MKIRSVEEKWMEEQEKQRDRDDALVAFIRTARERRDRERELEQEDLFQQERRKEQAAKFYELERRCVYLCTKFENANNYMKFDSGVLTATSLGQIDAHR